MQPYSSDLFSSRINRTSFFVRGALLLGMSFLVGLLFSAAHHAGFLTRVFCLSGGVCGLLVLFVAMFRLLLMPRLRDVGLHPAWSLLIFVHALSGLFLLALLIIPADTFARRRYLL